MANDGMEEGLSEGFWVGDWFVEPMLNRVVRGDEQVQLEPKVMDVLQLMAERPGKAVTKEAFMERVWTDTVVTDDVLSRCISQLRKVLGDDARDPDYIETIRKTGYRLIAPVRIPDAEETANPPSAAGESQPVAPSSPPRSPETTTDGGPGATLDEVAGNRTAPAPDDDASAERDVVREGLFEQRWMLIAAGLIVIGLAVAGGVALLAPSLFSTTPSAGPLEPVPFTSFPGRERDPALSPDGQQLAFTWGGEQQDFENIYLMQERANEPLRLTDVEANEWGPAWSPDGQQIAFVRSLEDGGCGVFIVSSIGGSERQLMRFSNRHVQALDWSPAPFQQHLVVALQQPARQSYGLYLLPIEGDTLIQLTEPPALSIGDTDPVFSPEGDRVAFTRTLIDGIQDIHAVAVDGGAATRVTSDSTRIAGFDWTPSGNQIIFASDREDTPGLWRAAVRGGSPERVLTASEGMQIQHPSLARAGTRLAYAQQSGRVNIWKVQDPIEYTNASTERLISSTQWDSNPDISPDGTRLVFASRRSGYPEIWTATPTGTDLKQVTSLEARGTQAPRWSPDGTRIAFTSRQPGHSDIYVVNDEGFQLRQVTQHPAEDLFPTWSRDGNALYFTSNRSGSWEVWTIPAQGGTAVQVTQGGATAAQEHPDGDALYLVRPDTTGIWEIPLADTARTFVFASSSPPPDTTAARSDSVVAGADSLAGMQRGVPRQVISSLNPRDRSNWQVRRRGIYFLRRNLDAGVLAFYRFSTRRVSPVFLLEGAPYEPSLSVAPEGDWFVYTRIELIESDVLLIEDFE